MSPCVETEVFHSTNVFVEPLSAYVEYPLFDLPAHDHVGDRIMLKWGNSGEFTFLRYFNDKDSETSRPYSPLLRILWRKCCNRRITP